MKTTKRISALILALCMILSVMPVLSAFAATPRLRINLFDDSYAPIQGAVFSIHKGNDEHVEDITTGIGGQAESSDLMPGDYYAVAKFIPAQYAQDSTKRYFTMEDNYITFDITLERLNLKGKLIISVIGDDATPLDNAMFDIFKKDGTAVQSLASVSGLCESGDLDPGEYYILQTASQPGYEIVDTPVTFIISDDGSVVAKDLINPRIFGKVFVQKWDQDHAPLGGAVFGIYDKDGVKVDEVTIPSSGSTLSASLPYGEYTLKELTAPEGYALNDTPIPFSILTQGCRVDTNITNHKIFGTLHLSKTNESGTPLAGAIFGIYKKNSDEKVGELATGSDGTALSAQLPKGEYYIKEISAPAGYVLSNDKTPFDISSNGQEYELTITNRAVKGSVKIIKSGEDDVKLPGVIFEIYTEANVMIGEITTDNQGIATLELSPGRYYAKEIKTATGYKLLSSSVSFVITDASPLELPILNQKESVVEDGKIKLVKKDEKSGKALSGAVFGIYNAGNDAFVAELSTSADGMATSGTLTEGSYYLKETKAPDGYKLKNDKIAVTVKKGETKEITVTNALQTGKIQVVKVAAGSLDKLKGAVFSVYKLANDEKIGDMTTDEKGIATFELPAGDYYLKESKAPDGYKLDETKISVSVKADETKEITVTNTLAVGKLQITKTATGNSSLKLKGAVFEIFKASTDVKAAELTTDTDGKASIELASGDYYLKESKAPDGYKLKSDKVPFTVVNGETKELTLTNAPAVGKVQITKTADGSTLKLKGAVFGIYKAANDEKMGEITTDTDGKASLELPTGDYYAKELIAPDGYHLNTEKIPFHVSEDETKELSIANLPTTVAPTTGKVQIVIKDETTGEKLPGAVFSLYETASGNKIAELTTDSGGMATSGELNAGDYYLVEQKAPAGYKLNPDRIGFTITAGQTKEVVVTKAPDPTSKPKNGTLQVIKKAEGSGLRLPGASFGVYKAANNEKVGEITTDSQGVATLELPEGEYYIRELRAPSGYVLETAKIAVTIRIGAAASIEVTNMSGDKPDYSDPNQGGAANGGITVPKTGEAFPYLTYALSALFTGISIICGAVYVRKFRKTRDFA